MGVKQLLVLDLISLNYSPHYFVFAFKKIRIYFKMIDV